MPGEGPHPAYETANGLARDIERYVADEPVEACPPSAAYRLRKFVRRNKVPVVAAGLVVLAFVAGIAGTTWGLILANQQRQLAEQQRQQADLARLAEAAHAQWRKNSETRRTTSAGRAE